MNQNISEMSKCVLFFCMLLIWLCVRLTNANHWIIWVNSPINPSQSLFNHFEDAEPLFRHMVSHSPGHAQSRANFIKRVFQRPKILHRCEGLGQCPEASTHNRWLQIKPRSHIPEIALVFSPSHCGLSGESYSIGFSLFERIDHKAFGSWWPAGNPRVTRG